MKWITPIVSWIAVLLLLPLALGQATISIVPSSQSVSLPNDATFDIGISGVTTPVYGFQFDISNSTSRWKLGQITEGSFLDRNGNDFTSCVGPTGEASKILTGYACTRISEASGVTGSGVLATIDLTNMLQAGTTTFTLTNVKLSDINSQPIPVATNGGTVTSSWCTDGTFQSCRIGGEPLNETGECSYGQEECVSGQWSGLCDSPAPVFSAAELCDGLDNDCDGSTDEGCDDDSDDYCDAGMTTVGTPAACPNGGGDCDDDDGAMHPGATETCNGANDDCDSSTDEGCDADNDDYCSSTMTIESPYSCSGGSWCCPSGGGDCDDSNGNVNPGESEICDGVNNDCAGGTDEGCDDDGDGYCDDSLGFSAGAACSQGDCDDDPGQCGSACSPGISQDVCPYTAYDEDCDGYDEYQGDTSVPGSSPCDGCVDIGDLSLIGSHFGETPSDSSWQPGTDLVPNSEIDIFDLVRVGSNFGRGLDGSSC